MALSHILWDASSLVKRYIIEIGSESVDALFVEAGVTPMLITPWGYLETYAILSRRYNAGAFNSITLTKAVTTLQSDVITGGNFQFIPVTDRAIFAASSLIDTHHINSADAAILSAYLQFRGRLPQNASCLLVASEKRLLRTANAEGFATLNPEMLSESDVPEFLALF